MPDLEKYAKQKRNDLKLVSGCTALVGLGVLVGLLIQLLVYQQPAPWWAFVSALLLPMALLIWWGGQRELNNALAGRTPSSVLAYYLNDLNDALTERATPDFAYAFTVSSARHADEAAFAAALRRSILEVFRGGTTAALVSGRCQGCGNDSEYVVSPLRMFSSYRLENDAEIALRCTKCQRLYCNICAAEVVRDKEKIFKPMRCACDSVLGTSHDKLIPCTRLREPGLRTERPQWSDRDDMKDARMSATALYVNTGIRTGAKATTGETKPIQFIAADLTILIPLRRIDGRWMVERLPQIIDTSEPKERWTNV